MCHNAGLEALTQPFGGPRPPAAGKRVSWTCLRRHSPSSRSVLALDTLPPGTPYGDQHASLPPGWARRSVSKAADGRSRVIQQADGGPQDEALRSPGFSSGYAPVPSISTSPEHRPPLSD
jgi:hypothetical protein